MELLQVSCIRYHPRKAAELGFGFFGFSSCRGVLSVTNPKVFPAISFKVGRFRHFECWSDRRLAKRSVLSGNATDKERKDKGVKKEHHLWMKRDSAGSGQKALNLVRIISKLPNEKEVIYRALDKWTAWETEFPLVAAAKALGILRKRSQWLRIIQVSKWLLSKGQALTMGTFDTLLLAFDMDGRVDEAESVWNMILHTYTRSVSKRLFSRMTALYDHHHMPNKILEVFADMEELGVKPDEDTIRRIGHAFQELGQDDKQKQVQSSPGSGEKQKHKSMTLNIEMED